MPNRGVVTEVARLGTAGLWAKQSGRQSLLTATTADSTVGGVGGVAGCGAILITVDWASTGVTLLTLTRYTPDGVGTVVRGSPVTLSAGQAIFWDAEAPLNTPVYYVASSTQTAGTTQSNTVTVVNTAQGCLSDPLNPANSVVLAAFGSTTPGCTDETGIAFLSLDSESYESTTGVFGIIGARRPRTVTSIRRDFTSVLRLASKTLADRDALNTLLGTGNDLLLRLSTTAYGWATNTYAADWISIDKVTAARLASPYMTRPQRLWTLPFTVVNAPAAPASTATGTNGIPAPGATWGDLLATGQTWGDLVTAGRSWRDLTMGNW